MTLNNSINGRSFEVFIEHFLVPNLWEDAVVVMDNLPAHKLGTIEPLIQVAGSSLLNLSPYSPDFNPIELWWSQLKSFLRQFSPSTTNMVDILLATILDLSILNTSKTGLQAADIVLYKPGICCTLFFIQTSLIFLLPPRLKS